MRNSTCCVIGIIIGVCVATPIALSVGKAIQKKEDNSISFPNNEANKAEVNDTEQVQIDSTNETTEESIDPSEYESPVDDDEDYYIWKENDVPQSVKDTDNRYAAEKKKAILNLMSAYRGINKYDWEKIVHIDDSKVNSGGRIEMVIYSDDWGDEPMPYINIEDDVCFSEKDTEILLSLWPKQLEEDNEAAREDFGLYEQFLCDYRDLLDDYYAGVIDGTEEMNHGMCIIDESSEERMQKPYVYYEPIDNVIFDEWYEYTYYVEAGNLFESCKSDDTDEYMDEEFYSSEVFNAFLFAMDATSDNIVRIYNPYDNSLHTFNIEFGGIDYESAEEL